MNALHIGIDTGSKDEAAWAIVKDGRLIQSGKGALPTIHGKINIANRDIPSQMEQFAKTWKVKR